MKKLLIVLLLLISACSSTTESSNAELPTITTGAFPIAWLSSELSAGCATVNDLTPAGGDVHDLELTPSQTASVVDADLVITATGFQSALDDAVANTSAPVLDLMTIVNPISGHSHDHDHGHSHESESGHSHESESGHSHEMDADGSKKSEILDPHFWLDPNRMIVAAAAIRDELSKLSDECRDNALENFANLEASLIQLDMDYQNGLRQCSSNTLVVSHEAFGYLGDVYELEQIAVTGLDPESEPSAARITEIINLAKEQKVSAVFTESSANPAVADILANELKVGVLPLNPIELKPASLDYLGEMQENLRNLIKGLDCK
ncbi:unannotated protein [freshwater metagenome]|uniref:Unannotated protein n=1 Tax=freshwater metagenome TaxID=449393 RepID=A0A6J6E5N3_9ZZZZ